MSDDKCSDFDVYYMTIDSDLEGSPYYGFNGCVLVPKGVEPAEYMRNIIETKTHDSGRIYFAGGCLGDSGKMITINDKQYGFSDFNVENGIITFDRARVHFSKLCVGDVIVSSIPDMYSGL